MLRVLRILVVILASTVGSAAAADRRTWTLERQGVTFELTPGDLRAWTGDPSGPPAFSMAALLAAEKKEFDEYAEELAKALEGPDAREYPDNHMAQWMTLEVLSVVGTLVSYRDVGGSDTPGTAHPLYGEFVRVRDVQRLGATPSLLDFFSEKEIVAALKADPWIRKFANPAKAFERAASLKELVQALDSGWAQAHSGTAGHDCTLDVSFYADMVEQFFFHHVAKDRVGVRIAVGPGREQCDQLESQQQIGLLLPIPERLRDDLLEAARGEAGFLAADRKAAGSPSYSGRWEVDVRTLVRKPPQAR